MLPASDASVMSLEARVFELEAQRDKGLGYTRLLEQRVVALEAEMSRSNSLETRLQQLEQQFSRGNDWQRAAEHRLQRADLGRTLRCCSSEWILRSSLSFQGCALC